MRIPKTLGEDLQGFVRLCERICKEFVRICERIGKELQDFGGEDL